MRSTPLVIGGISLLAAMLACNLPSGDQVSAAATAFAATQTAEAENAGASKASPGAEADVAETPTATTEAAPTSCTATATANLNANVRMGPSTLYSEVGYLPTQGTAPIEGQNDLETWWYIVFADGPGGHAWIAKSVTTASCLPPTVPVVAAPPLPPTSTPTEPAEEFAVIHVEAEVTGSCPNFHYKFKVTTNGPGTVTYHRVWSDGGTDSNPGSLDFAAAGTKVAAEYDRFFNVAHSSAWTDLYIDSPNHQQFGRANFSCP